MHIVQLYTCLLLRYKGFYNIDKQVHVDCSQDLEQLTER